MQFLKNQLFKNARNYFLGNLGVSAISFLAVPIFTRLLSTSDYGQLSIYTSFLAINMILFSLGFSGAISNKYMKEEHEFPTFLGTNLMFLTAAQVVLLGLLFLSNDWLADYFNTDKKILIFANISGVLMVFYNVFKSYQRASEKSASYVRYSFAYTLIGIFASIVFVLLLDNNKYLGRIYGYLTGIIVVSVLSIVSLVRIAKFRFEKRHLMYALGFGIPLIPHLASQYVLSSFDKIIINQLTGSSNTGIYSLGYNVGTVYNALVVAVISAFVPKFYKYLKVQDFTSIDQHAKVLTRVVFTFGIAMMLFSKELLIIMADQKFHKAVDIIPMIIVGIAFFYLYMIYSVYATYEKKTMVFSLITIFAGAINVYLNYTLIPLYGYMIAATTTMISYFILFISHFTFAKVVLKKRVIPLQTHVKAGVIFLIVSLVFMYYVTNINIYWLNLLIRIFLATVSIFLLLGSEIKAQLRI